MKSKPLHFNAPQIKTMLVDATETYVVAGRGVGKSSGIIAPWLIKRASEMPRSMGGIIGATYQQLLVRTLPPVLATWKRMGYRHGVHYIMGKDPMSSQMAAWRRMWNWEDRMPHTMPLESKYAIYWFNGSVQVLISQDRPGSSNGLSLAYFSGDEAKLLNKPRVDEEVIPTLRGNRAEFGHLPGYGGQMFTTDMPTTAQAKWILEKAEQMDVEQITQILNNQLTFNLKQKQYHQASPAQKKLLAKEMRKIEHRLRVLRLGATDPEDERRKISTYYLEASALDNLDVLGKQYLQRMKQSLTDLQYRTSILNQKLNKIEGGFYSNFDPDQHGTDWFDYSYIDKFPLGTQFKEDCRQDDGAIPSEPLDIACDYGTFNCMVVGQQVGKEYRLLRGFHKTKTEGLIQHVAQDFIEYYKYYPTKRVNFYYDHTAIFGIGNTDKTYAQSVIDTLREAGWIVNEVYVGRTANPGIRYKLINTLFAEEDEELLKVRYSRSGLKAWEIAMGNCGIKEGKNGFEKDKSPEKNPDQDQTEAPHYTDAGDNLLFYRAAQKLVDSGHTPTMSMR